MTSSSSPTATSNIHDVLDSDILFALALHVLVIGGLLLYMLYQPQQQTKPLERIEVSMISAEELDRQLKRKPEVEKNEPVKPAPEPVPVEAPKPEPVVVETPKPEPMPVEAQQAKPIEPPVSELPKLTEKPEAKPQPIKQEEKPKPVKVVEKTKPKAKEKPTPHKAKPTPHKAKEAAFDPFAPAVSSPGRTAKHTAPRINKAELQARQLSSRELDRYIAMMRSAVQRHWKVPGGLSQQLRDPLVRVDLNRDGSVKNIRIIESSGQVSFDQTLINAIRAAAPFTLPREQYAVFKSNKIRFHAKQH